MKGIGKPRISTPASLNMRVVDGREDYALGELRLSLLLPFLLYSIFLFFAWDRLLLILHLLVALTLLLFPFRTHILLEQHARFPVFPEDQLGR
jgi:hypothetical protein